MKASRAAVVAMLALWTAAPAVVARQAVFRSQVEMVRVDVAVARSGRPVTGLGPKDFELRDSGVRQDVREVLVENVPIDVTLVLDTSSSVAGRRLERLQDAATRLLRGLRAGDRAGLMTFTHRVSRVQPLTADLQEVARRIAGVEGNGLTALHDAVFAGLLQRPADGRRTVLVVFSDGVDTASWLSAKQVLGAARGSAALVYAVAEIADPVPALSDTDTPKVFLGALAIETGGRTWWVPDPDRFREAFEKILQEITTRYVLLYEPEGVSAAGWHPISVRLARASADVMARPGYFRK